MDRQQILLAKALEAADVPVLVDRFDDRLILQKAVYLLQNAGIHLGYRYRWHLRGPYSTGLTSDAFSLSEAGDTARSELNRYTLDSAARDRIQALKPMLARQGTIEPQWLELLASTLFLVKTKQASANQTDLITSILQKYEKPFSLDNVKEAIEVLEANGLLT